MRILLSIALFLSAIAAIGQTTFTTKYKTGWSTDSCNARVTIPQWYGTSAPTDSAQAIICFLGAGEVGTDTSFLTKYGPHSYIKGGWDGGILLGNGLHYPIIITIQEPALYYRPFYYKRVLDTIMTKYKIFRRSLHLTGYSMGGWTANQIAIYRPSTTDSTYAFRPKSIVNVQGVKPDDTYDATPAPYPAGFPSFARNGGYQTIGREWGFEQSNDFRDINTIITTMNGAVSGSAQYNQTNFGTGGHGSFEQWYGSPSNTPQKWTGFHPAVLEDVYQFMLRQGDTVADQHGGVNVPPTVNAGGNRSINLPTNSITLTGTASGNNGATITSTTWSKISGGSATIVSPSSLTTNITGLVQGTYVFQLSATDNNNLTSTDQMTLTVNGASTAPTASAGGPYYVDQSNAYDLILNGSATGNNLKYFWNFPCNCYTGNDNLTKTSFTGGDPRVLKIVAPYQLNAQVIQMKLNGGDSVHRYWIYLTVTDSVSGQSATDSAQIIYRYWTIFPPQNSDGAVAHHTATTSDSINLIGPACWVGHDQIYTGANNDAVRGQYTSIYVYKTYPDTFHVTNDATRPTHIWIAPGNYFNIHFEADTVGGSGWNPPGDTTKAQLIIAPYPGKGKLVLQAGIQIYNFRNTRITGVYDTALHLGTAAYPGHDKGYAYTDTLYGIEANNYYRSTAGHGFQLEGISSQKVEFDHCASIRGNFGGFTLKAEYSGIANPSTHPQVFWEGLKVHDCFVSSAHGENFYIGSANNPGTWLNNSQIYNNRSVFSGNKLFKTIDLYKSNLVQNNVGSFGSIDAPSPFSVDVSVGHEIEFVNTGNVIQKEIINGAGNQLFNVIEQKFGGPNPSGSNYIKSNLLYYTWGTIDWFVGQLDSPFTVIADSNYVGGALNFQFNKIYNAPRGTNTLNTLYQTTAAGVPPQATRSNTQLRWTTYDSTKYNLTQGNSDGNFTGSTGNVLIKAITPPSFTQTGFAPGDYPMQWVDTVGKMWGDEYASTEFKQGTPMYYDSGQVVKWFDKFYRSKINNNVGHPPTGVTDAYWTLILFSNGSYTPPNDLTLNPSDMYYQKGMGLLPQAIQPAQGGPGPGLICNNCVFK